MKITLRSRIYLALLPLLILFLGLASFLVFSARDTQLTNNAITDANLALWTNFIEIDENLVALEAIIDSKSEGSLERRRPQIEQHTKTLKRYLMSTSALLENKQLASLQEEINAYEYMLAEIVELSEKLIADPRLQAPLLFAIDQAQEATKVIRERWEGHIYEKQSLSNSQRTRNHNIVIACMVLAIVLTLVISTLIWKRIIQPIEEITQSIDAYSSESTPQKINYNARDELGDLARTFTRMTERLTEFQSLSNRKLMRSTTALQSILNHSPDAFFVLNETWKPIFSSPKANELLEQSRIKVGFPPKMLELFESSLQADKPIVFRDFSDAIRLTVEDTERWFLIQTFPIRIPSTDVSANSDSTGERNLAVILQDVTLLKLSDSLRKDLVATVSHELKTPITSARMCLYLLLEESLGSINADQKELLETARDDINRQLTTIEHLLDLSRFEADSDALKLSHFRISALLAECIETHLEVAKSYNVSLNQVTPKEPISVEADRNGLSIVINNFLVNAIKYSGQGKQVEIIASRTDTHLKVAVKDNGPGMDEATLSSVFDAYSRGESGNHSVKGTGLGLKISKDIVESHSGQIGCDSKVGEGSTFFVEIPLTQA